MTQDEIPQVAMTVYPVPERIWINFTNVCKKGMFKVELEINGQPFKVFEQYVSQEDGVLCESWNITWLLSDLRTRSEALLRAAEEMHETMKEAWPDRPIVRVGGEAIAAFKGE